MYYAKSEQGEYTIKFFHEHESFGTSAGGHPWQGTTRVEIFAPGGELFRQATVKRGLGDNFSRHEGRKFAILRATEGLDRSLRNLLCSAVLGRKPRKRGQVVLEAIPGTKASLA